MNDKAQDAANKVMAAFESGGILPLENEQPDKYAEIARHVYGVLARAMESQEEKKARKWNDWQRVKNEVRA